MNALDALNEPVEFTLAGIVLSVRRVNSIRRLAIKQAVWLSDQIEAIKIKAQAFPESERQGYIRSQIDLLPDSNTLSDMMVKERTTEPVWLRWLVEACVSPKISLEEMGQLLDDASQDEVTAVITWIISGKKK